MDLAIQTSTPIIYDKMIIPPPRRLWGEDSPTEQLYHNKWVKYRNSIDGKELSWSGLNAPCFVDFENICDIDDSYFDHTNEQKFVTPHKTLDKPLPGLEENNNILDKLKSCSLSAIKKPEIPSLEGNNKMLDPLNRYSLLEKKKPEIPSVEENNKMLDFLNRCSLSTTKTPEHMNENDANRQPTQLNGAVKLIPYFSESLSTVVSSTSQSNGVKETDTNIPEAPDARASNDSVEKPRLNKSNFATKKKLDYTPHCTIIEPFSFETREKRNQEHKQARRERDSAGKETWKGFRANPVPNFIKLREKKSIPVKRQIKKNKPSLPKKVTVVPKAPQLLTAVRAKERQRFENQLREKERQKQALQQMEEAARKKREEEEIAKLRKESVHKAQPIRKYKIIVPKVEKRPLSEPTTPLPCKRRRKV